MSKFTQIAKLANAAMSIQEVAFNHEVTDKQSAELQEIADKLAEIADEIEGVE